MDDKEKEKFGVIIDKNDQGTDNQSKVDDTSVNPEINKESKISELENKTLSEEKQPESDMKTETDATTQSEGNLNENKDESPEKDKPDGSNDVAETSEEKKEHQVIHKKDGRLHIYVRQDKYKGELKSKNWVGRLYIDGKQKISSSGTQNLDEAIPILEKWFDDIQAESEKQKKLAEEAQQNQQTSSTQPTAETIVEEKTTPTATPTTTSEVAPQKINKVEEQGVDKEVSLANQSVSTSSEEIEDTAKSKVSNILGKFKNLKFKKPSLSSLKGIKLPKSPVKSKDIENICKKVFNLANPDTGKFTCPFAKNSLKPEIKISRVKIIIAAITS